MKANGYNQGNLVNGEHRRSNHDLNGGQYSKKNSSEQNGFNKLTRDGTAYSYDNQRTASKSPKEITDDYLRKNVRMIIRI